MKTLHKSIFKLLAAGLLLTLATLISCPTQAAAPAAIRPNIAGQIVTAAGKPLPGATVYVYTAHPRFGTSSSCPSCYADCGKTATTDKNGHFKIASLDHDLVFRLLVVRNSYASEFVDEVDPLKTGERVHVAMTARALDVNAVNVLHGHVSDETGAPVVGATITFNGIAFQKPVSGVSGLLGGIPGIDPLVITDSQGDYRVKVPDNTQTLDALVEARGLAPVTVAGLLPGPTADNQTRLQVGGTVQGKVLAPDGGPLGNAVIEIVPVDKEIECFTGWQHIATDGQGNFSLPNLPAATKYDFMALMDSPPLKGRNWAAPMRVIATGADNSVTNVGSITLTPSSRIYGKVVTADGRPVPPGTRIDLNRDGTWDAQQAMLGANGSFAFGNIPMSDTLDLSLVADGYHLDPATLHLNKWARSQINLPGVTATQPLHITLRLVPDSPSVASR